MECGSYQTLKDEKNKKVMHDPQHCVCIADEAPVNQQADQSRVCPQSLRASPLDNALRGNHGPLRSQSEPIAPACPDWHLCAAPQSAEVLPTHRREAPARSRISVDEPKGKRKEGAGSTRPLTIRPSPGRTPGTEKSHSFAPARGLLAKETRDRPREIAPWFFL